LRESGNNAIKEIIEQRWQIRCWHRGYRSSWENPANQVDH